MGRGQDTSRGKEGNKGMVGRAEKIGGRNPLPYWGQQKRKKREDSGFKEVLKEMTEKVFNNQDLTDEQIVELWNKEGKEQIYYVGEIDPSPKGARWNPKQDRCIIRDNGEWITLSIGEAIDAVVEIRRR